MRRPPQISTLRQPPEVSTWQWQSPSGTVLSESKETSRNSIMTFDKCSWKLQVHQHVLSYRVDYLCAECMLHLLTFWLLSKTPYGVDTEAPAFGSWSVVIRFASCGG